MPGAQEGWGFCLPLGIYFSSCMDSSIAEVLKHPSRDRPGDKAVSPALCFPRSKGAEDKPRHEAQMGCRSPLFTLKISRLV